METVAARCPGLMKRAPARPRSAMTDEERKDTLSYAARFKGFSRIRMADESFRGERASTSKYLAQMNNSTDVGRATKKGSALRYVGEITPPATLPDRSGRVD